MTRQLLAAAATAVCVAFAGDNTASAHGPHQNHHHHHHHGGSVGYGYPGAYRPRYYAPPVVVRPRPVYVAPDPCYTGYGNPGYGGYGPSGIGFSNRNFSVWLGR